MRSENIMYSEKYIICEVSRLYHQQPISIGTPYVESLTSYVKRLAQAHRVSVGSLIRKEIMPDMDIDYLGIYHFLGANARKINIMQSDIPEAIVRVLEEKTCKYNLSYLTMNGWEKCFNSKDMFREKHAWCPFCYEESLQLPYEQLIWNFKDVDICRKHNTRLVQNCPYCNSELEILTSLSRIGYCDKCNSWLGLKKHENCLIPIINEDWQNWVYDNIGQLLTVLPTQKEADLIQFRKNIIWFCKSGSFKNICSEIGVSYRATQDWRNGCKPRLANVLGLSFRLGYSVYEILTKDISTLNNIPLDKRFILKTKKPRNKTGINEMKKALDEAIVLNNGMSIKKLTKRLSVKRETLIKHFPKEVAKLIENYNEFLNAQKRDRFNLIRNTTKLLVQDGIYPSQKAFKYVTGKWILQNEADKRALYETLEEIGCTREGYNKRVP